MPLYLHLLGTGGTTGRMECFNGNAVVTWVEDAWSSFRRFPWESSAVSVPFQKLLAAVVKYAMKMLTLFNVFGTWKSSPPSTCNLVVLQAICVSVPTPRNAFSNQIGKSDQGWKWRVWGLAYQIGEQQQVLLASCAELREEPGFEISCRPWHNYSCHFLSVHPEWKERQSENVHSNSHI